MLVDDDYMLSGEYSSFFKCNRSVMSIFWVPTVYASHTEKLSKYSSYSSPPHSLVSLQKTHYLFLLVVLPLWPHPSSALTAFCLIICKSSMSFQACVLMNIYGTIYPGARHTMAPFCIVKRSGILCTGGSISVWFPWLPLRSLVL